MFAGSVRVNLGKPKLGKPYKTVHDCSQARHCAGFVASGAGAWAGVRILFAPKLAFLGELIQRRARAREEPWGLLNFKETVHRRTRAREGVPFQTRPLQTVHRRTRAREGYHYCRHPNRALSARLQKPHAPERWRLRTECGCSSSPSHR